MTSYFNLEIVCKGNDGHNKSTSIPRKFNEGAISWMLILVALAGMTTISLYPEKKTTKETVSNFYRVALS